MDFGTFGTVHLLWRLSGLQCSITRTTWATASQTSTTGRIPTPVGVGILQAHFNFIEPSVLLYFLQVRRPPVWNAQLHAATSGLHWRKSRVSHQPGFFFSTVCFLRFPVAGCREQGSRPTPVQHQGRRRSVRWTECVTFPLGQGCACPTSFPT